MRPVAGESEHGIAQRGIGAHLGEGLQKQFGALALDEFGDEQHDRPAFGDAQFALEGRAVLRRRGGLIREAVVVDRIGHGENPRGIDAVLDVVAFVEFADRQIRVHAELQRFEERALGEAFGARAPGGDRRSLVAQQDFNAAFLGRQNRRPVARMRVAVDPQRVEPALVEFVREAFRERPP